ncbi:MAG: glycosyltransferase family 39 protein [Candidatus Saganbacteria bacterium]|nr:glycosyltransferase family 39 protein [Candidatus Saganbacteria bacterium]
MAAFWEADVCCGKQTLEVGIIANNFVGLLMRKKVHILIFLILISIPLIVLTFDTGNWSDDYQLIHLTKIKQAISPHSGVVFDLLLPRTDGHFIPVYYLINILIMSFGSSSQWFHFVVILFYIGNGFLLYLIVKRVFNDSRVAFLSSILFSVNYCVGFKALTWNCFHSHATNVFTGLLSVYFVLQFIENKKVRSLFLMSIFLLLTILNIESGFVFFVVLFVFATCAFFRKQLKVCTLSFVFFAMAAALIVFSMGAYWFTGSFMPLASERFASDAKEISQRSPARYAKHTVTLALRLANIPFYSNRWSKIVGVVRNNMPRQLGVHLRMVVFIGFILLFVFFIFIAYLYFMVVHPPPYEFLISFMLLFLTFIFVFDRIDIANSVVIFSSVIIADFVLSLLRFSGRFYRKIGWGILTFFVVMPLIIILNGFNIAYATAYISKQAKKSEEIRINAINHSIGHYSDKTIIFVNLDNKYIDANNQRSTVDFAADNVRMYFDEFARSESAKQYALLSYNEFVEKICLGHMKTIQVLSKKDAQKYIRNNRKQLVKTALIYVDENNVSMPISLGSL